MKTALSDKEKRRLYHRRLWKKKAFAHEELFYAAAAAIRTADRNDRHKGQSGPLIGRSSLCGYDSHTRNAALRILDDVYRYMIARDKFVNPKNYL